MIRSRILFLVLALTGVCAALLFIAQLWLEILGDDIFLKTLASLGIAGSTAAFLMAVNYDLPNSRARIFLGILVALGTAGSGLLLTWMWTDIFSDENFLKLIVTDIILIVMAAFLMVLGEDFRTQKKLKDEKYLD